MENLFETTIWEDIILLTFLAQACLSAISILGILIFLLLELPDIIMKRNREWTANNKLLFLFALFYALYPIGEFFLFMTDIGDPMYKYVFVFGSALYLFSLYLFFRFFVLHPFKGNK